MLSSVHSKGGVTVRRSVMTVSRALISSVIGISIILFSFSIQVFPDITPTIKNKIPLPSGYQRIDFPHDSFNNWIQNLPLKSDLVIMDYRGHTIESGFYNLFGVVRIPLLFKSDLEQCADFAMRFWAEYHKENGKLNQLFLFDYSGRKLFFKDSGKSYTAFPNSLCKYQFSLPENGVHTRQSG